MSSFTSKTIYQAIWDADQQQNGVPAIMKSNSSSKDTCRGYVIVNEPSNFNKDTRVLEEVLIPREKKKTYNLCENLFNNYVLQSSRIEETETETPEETIEINSFISAIVDTKPMKIARGYMAPNQTDDEWFQSIREKWFAPFALSSAKSRSGFEHVFVGEDTGNLGGYHFWYKYYVDNGAGRTDGKDVMDYLGAKYGSEAKNEVGRSVPEVVTLSHVWDAYHTPDDPNDDLNKRVGGFWVGCSPEGLIALGMARFKDEAQGSTKAPINNAEYEIRLYTDVDRREESNKDKVAKHINTFYPILVGKVADAVDPSPPVTEPKPDPDPPVTSPSSGDVRIIAALVNPSGPDQGKENVTIINISNVSANMTGWTIVDKNGNFFQIDGVKGKLDAGEVHTITLPGTGSRPTQLANKGGSITLKDGSGAVVNEVSYTSKQSSKQGFTTLF